MPGPGPLRVRHGASPPCRMVDILLVPRAAVHVARHHLDEPAHRPHNGSSAGRSVGRAWRVDDDTGAPNVAGASKPSDGIDVDPRDFVVAGDSDLCYRSLCTPCRGAKCRARWWSAGSHRDFPVGDRSGCRNIGRGLNCAGPDRRAVTEGDSMRRAYHLEKFLLRNF